MGNKKTEIEEEPFDDPILEARYQLVNAINLLKKEKEKRKIKTH